MAGLRVALVGCGALGEIVANDAYPMLAEVATVTAVVDPVVERAETLATATWRWWRRPTVPLSPVQK